MSLFFKNRTGKCYLIMDYSLPYQIEFFITVYHAGSTVVCFLFRGKSAGL